MNDTNTIRVISLGHRIPERVKKQIETKLNTTNIAFIDLPFVLIMGRDLAAQITALLFPIIKENSDMPLLIMPGVSVAAALVTVIMYGWFGAFPPVVELKKDRDRPWLWNLKEIHQLDDLRHHCRRHGRTDLMSEKPPNRAIIGV
ncbi:hypothetical protein KKH13_04910 [Patescibacteria group bacterium]|uniref:Uncharacterized protein n=1 Tax=viral metagenome TaxID=1070528 RepID=A0A6M3LAB7_9ZZZZ|nr:hypothetical protein [Patescibacteria group bacterium]